jgi:ABC-type uncharacterized transport system YnjBCD permease subunit
MTDRAFRWLRLRWQGLVGAALISVALNLGCGFSGYLPCLLLGAGLDLYTRQILKDTRHD